jgi:inner membrane transporter RhtA
MVSLLPATATAIGVVVLTQVPSVPELLGVALVVAGVAVHRQSGTPAGTPSRRRVGVRGGRARGGVDR